ncbi:MAG: hypothetical protein ACOXZ9_08895 [Bacteroidales bacterium]|jgi:hypothetical protein
MRLKTKRLLTAVLATILVVTFSTELIAQEKKSAKSANYKEFKIVIERTDNGLKLLSYKGSAWTDLSFTFSSDEPQAIDEYGMTKLGEVSDKKDPELADYLFTITETEDGVILKSIEGTAWKSLDFSLPKGEKQAIDQVGMTSVLGIKLKEEISDSLKEFRITIEKTYSGFKLYSDKGSAWVNLSFTNTDSIPQAINEQGVTKIGEAPSSKKDQELASYLLTIGETDYGIVLKGIEGTAWEEINFTLQNGTKQAIDQLGITYISETKERVKEKKPLALKEFKIIVERTDNGIKLESVNGSAWTDLSFTFSSDEPQAIDEYGMTKIGEVSDKKDPELADYLFTITETESGVILKGIEGTAWEKLDFYLPKGAREAINQSGMTSISDFKIEEDNSPDSKEIKKKKQ